MPIEATLTHSELTNGAVVEFTLIPNDAEPLDSVLRLKWPNGRKVRLTMRELGLLTKAMDGISKKMDQGEL